MWWCEFSNLGERIATMHSPMETSIHAEAIIEPGAVLDDATGPIVIGSGTRICSGSVLRGPLIVGQRSLIGNHAFIRGPSIIGSDVSIGFTSEVKHAAIGDRTSIGPMCFIADSVIECDAYLGALVRTSNQRLDRKPVTVMHEGKLVETGSAKLGCKIGPKASIGIQVIILPGREIAAGSIFEPRITITKNHPSGHYRSVQTIEQVNKESGS